MTALDGTVLVRDAAVVTGRHHAVMSDKRREATGQVLDIRPGQIAKRGRETVAAMLQGNPAQQARGVLQTAGQGRVTLAAQYDLGMFEAGKGECEMIKPVFQPLAANDNAETVRVSSSHRPSSGLGRVRQVRRCFFVLGGRGSRSMRRADATDRPALAAAVIWG